VLHQLTVEKVVPASTVGRRLLCQIFSTVSFVAVLPPALTTRAPPSRKAKGRLRISLHAHRAGEPPLAGRRVSDTANLEIRWTGHELTTSSSTAHSREREANSQRRHTRGSTLGHMSVCNEHNIIGRNKSFASASRRACPCGPMRAEREREKERESTALRRAFGPGAEGLSTGFTLSVSPQPDSPLSCPQAFVAAT
jgi:hypothetical protein